MEIEIKLRLLAPVPPERIAALDLGPYQLGEVRVHQLHDRLLDTPDGALAATQRALRIRRDGASLLITVKGPPAGTGHLHRRDEIEAVVERDPTETGVWPDDVRSALVGVDLSSLEERVTVVNHRVAWQVEREGRAVAELALDEGAVIVAEVRERFHELEVELRPGGTPEDLSALEALLRKQLDVVPEPRSKLERGLALRQRLALPGGQQLAALGAQSLRKNLDRLRRAEGIAREGIDPEGVHDLRVATRRLRTALQLLAEAGIAPKRLDRHRRALRALARAAAAVRDADVQLQAFAAEAPAEFVLAVEQQRAAGRAQLLAALDSPETASALARLDAEIARLRERGESPPPHDGSPSLARHFVGSLLWRRYEAVLAYETALPVATPETLHQLRIAIKRLRYAVEFFAEALGAEAKQIRSLLAEFQELLGAHQDAYVALALARSLADRSSDRAPLEAFIARCRAAAAALAEQVQARWHELGGPAFRDLLGRALASAAPSRD
ncbi:MAG: CHAD domain-containing protein [Chloroflexota bacterium]|nr:CHAD domain-containing protein [Dehalococcoidia bacterium]MDW8253516.1 CHAD domain-containing protein [Chloroflexota bacterium]